MERVFQSSYKPSHCRTIGNMGGAFGGENTVTVSQVFLVVKTLLAAGCDEIRLTSVSNSLVFWKATERLAN